MTAGQSSGTETNVPGTKTGPDNIEWDQFRTDFMEKLKASDHEVNIEPGTSSTVKNHLLIEAISELQSQDFIPEPCQSVSSNSLTTCTSTQASITTPNVSSQPNDDLSSIPEPLLSTAILDGIDLSALDRALEEVEIGGAINTGAERLTTHQSPPKLAWGDSCSHVEDVPDLISELKVIQAKELELCSAPINENGVQTRVEDMANIGAGGAVKGSSEVDRDENGKKPVFIDLRPPHNYKQLDSDSMQCVHSNQLKQ